MPINIVGGTFVRIDDDQFAVVPQRECKCICLFNKKEMCWKKIYVEFPDSYPKYKRNYPCCVDKKKKNIYIYDCYNSIFKWNLDNHKFKEINVNLPPRSSISHVFKWTKILTTSKDLCLITDYTKDEESELATGRPAILQLKKVDDNDNEYDAQIITKMKENHGLCTTIPTLYHKNKIYFISNYIHIIDIKTKQTRSYQFKPNGSYDATKNDKWFKYASAVLLDDYDVLICLTYCGQKKAEIDVICIGDDGFELKWERSGIQAPVSGDNGDLMVLYDKKRPEFVVHGYINSLWSNNEEFHAMQVLPIALIKIVLKYFGRRDAKLFWMSWETYKKRRYRSNRKCQWMDLDIVRRE